MNKFIDVLLTMVLYPFKLLVCEVRYRMKIKYISLLYTKSLYYIMLLPIGIEYESKRK